VSPCATAIRLWVSGWAAAIANTCLIGLGLGAKRAISNGQYVDSDNTDE